MAQAKLKKLEKKISAQKLTEVLIVDDHRMVRDGIRSMLELKFDKYKFSITESDSGEDALIKVAKNDYDIILMDYQMSGINGADTVERLIAFNPDQKILALSNYDDYTYIKKIMKAGAKGYVLKNINPDELVLAIDTILSGKMYYANDVAVKLIHPNKAYTNTSGLVDVSVSLREREVLTCIADELSNDEIAVKLDISKRTVDSHRQNLIRKLEVKNTAGLVKYALEHKLV